MITPPSLGPLSTAEIFDTAFRLYRTHFGTFLRIVLSLYGPLILLKFVIAILLIESEEWGNFLGWPLPLGMPYGMTYSSFGHIPMLISGTLRGVEFLFIHPISVGLICNITARSYLQRPVALQIPHNYNHLRFAILCLSEILFFLIGIIMLITGGVRPARRGCAAARSDRLERHAPAATGLFARRAPSRGYLDVPGRSRGSGAGGVPAVMARWHGDQVKLL
jgi:hypothetical protein